jgi:hypothetical protein
MNQSQNTQSLSKEDDYRKLITAIKGSLVAAVWYQAHHSETSGTAKPESANNCEPRPLRASTAQDGS